MDPSLRVQEVIYTADADGFHVENSNLPEYTQAQLAEREKHALLFQQIADEHVKIGAEHALEAAERGYEPHVPQPWVQDAQGSSLCIIINDACFDTGIIVINHSFH